MLVDFADSTLIQGLFLQDLPIRVCSKSDPRLVSGILVGVNSQIAEIWSEWADESLAYENRLNSTIEKDRDLSVVEHMDLQVTEAFI